MARKELVNGVEQDMSAEDEAILDQQEADDAAHQQQYGYKEDRARAYPNIQDQLDMQYHDAVNGTTTWKDAIQAVKDANPKPTE